MKRTIYSLGNSLFCLLYRFERRGRDKGQCDEGHHNGANANRER